MSVTGSQQRVFLGLVAQLRPHWRRDPALPARIQSLLAGRREFGSRDRRLYRELLYTTLRYLPWVEPWIDVNPEEAVRRVAWLAAETPATKGFCATFATGAPPSGDKAELLPAWFRSHCPEIFAGAELETQLRRAPLWLRLQTSHPEQVLAEFDARGWQWRRSEIWPSALELLTEADVTRTEAWTEGQLEVQDLGSQLILASIGIEENGAWLDACAGAGGKTLQLSQMLGPTGQIDAHDVRQEALLELQSRAIRAGIACQGAGMPSGKSTRRSGHPRPAAARCASIRVTTELPTRHYDGVLVDAPCSGSGTWRRAPHLKWVTSEAQIARSAETQRKLLGQFSAHVKPGGRLIYATCSLSSAENEEVVAAFLAAQRDFHPEEFARDLGGLRRGVAGLLFLPSRHDTDGFFVASLRRR